MDVQAPSLPASQESLVSSTELAPSITPNLPSDAQFVSPEPASQTKFTSPPPLPTSSMTPPPSSQVPNARDSTRTPTPPTPQLTSPPPTTKLFSQASMLADTASIVYSPDEINNAPPEQRGAMVADLCSAFRDMRVSAAHYKLQYNMVAMQFQELENRMTVELDMAQREIEVLKQAEERRRTSPPAQSMQESPVDPSQAIIISELNRTCQLQRNEIEQLFDQLDEQKRLTAHREGELATAMEENDRLKTRIRRNRDHVSQFLPYTDEHGSPRSLLATPHQPTPRHRHRAATQTAADARGQSNFEALLLADKMLSQETATAPATPNRAPGPRSRYTHGHGHIRGAQSMSSLPNTPNRGRSNTQSQVHPRTPPTFTHVGIPQSAPPAHYQYQHAQPNAHAHPPPHAHGHGHRQVATVQKPPQHLRRESSNSTITASSVDDEEAYTDREHEHEDGGAETEADIPESQASRVATSMLRRQSVSQSHSQSQSQGLARSPFSSQKSMGAPSHPFSHKERERERERERDLVQSKIFGRVVKKARIGEEREGGFEKRRFEEGGEVMGASPTKRGRTDRGQGVGLGIGGLRE